jgi:erythromycin esterase-like protein
VQAGKRYLAWEADWPNALRMNRYVRGKGNDQTAIEALSGFERFPTWMWRNADILARRSLRPFSAKAAELR